MRSLSVDNRFGNFTNLALNPSFETLGSGVEVYRNFLRNPSFGMNTGNWASARDTVVSRDTVEFSTGVASLKVVTPGVQNLEGTNHAALAVSSMAQGDVFFASARVKVPAGVEMRLEAASSGAGNTNSVTSFTGTGDWQEVSATGAVLGANLNPYVIVRTPTVTATTFYIDTATVGMGTYAFPLFDGSYSPDPDLTPSWTGTADASESVLTGVVPANTWTGSSSYSIQSTQWSLSGSKSVRVISLVAGSYVDAVSFPGASVRGKTLTVSATSRATETVPGSSARRIGLRLVGHSPSVIYSQLSENVPGEERLTLTYTIPDDPAITAVYVRLFNGGAIGDPDVWWDDLTIVEGPSY